MKYKAWLMLETHQFVRAEGNTVEELRKDTDSKYDDTYVFDYVSEGNKKYKGIEIIAGWGRVSIKGLDPDKFNAFDGLNKREELRNLTEERITKEIDEQVAKYISAIQKDTKDNKLLLETLQKALED